LLAFFIFGILVGFLFLFLSCFVYSTGDCTQGLALARQAFYDFSHISRPFSLFR
jgi:hypothetical protein